MQAYGPGFARVYNQRWAGFARQAAPVIRDYYEQMPIAESNRALLDLGCGTGQLARHFLEHGYRVTGFDLSEAMLEHARESNEDYLGTGHARFERTDIARFSIADRFGLALATYDTLNHLDNLDALASCFRSTLAALLPGGVFIFDLNTRLGLRRWNGVSVEEADDALIVTRGVYDGVGDRAVMRISGFVKVKGNLFERFEETVYNTAFAIKDVRQTLYEVGLTRLHFAVLNRLDEPLGEPEAEGRVFVVARKGEA